MRSGRGLCGRDRRAVPAGQYVLVAVADTGTGMDKATLSASSSRSSRPRSRQGHGLGLSQVYGFVKQSGGHVRIYSELGQGTTVKIYLPRLVGTLRGAPRGKVRI